MRRITHYIVGGATLLLAAQLHAADSTVAVPWEDFQRLYHESLERSLREELTPPAVVHTQQVHVLEDAIYSVSASRTQASGTITLSGRVLRGTPTEIPLLDAGWVLTGSRRVEGGTLLRGDRGSVSLLPEGPGAFSVELDVAMPVRVIDEAFAVDLAIPRALRNALKLELAEDLQLSAAPGIPAADSTYHLSADERVTLRFAPRPTAPVVKPKAIREYTAVAAPVPVLDEVTFCAAFEENGAVLSTLILDVPPTASGMFPLSPVEGARVWSLDVDGRTRKLYSGDEGRWLVPVPTDRGSRVTLSLIQDSARLGLQGRVEAIVPATGLPARRLRVCIGLPDRVVLTSLEAPLSTTAQERWDPPSNFAGKPYRFGRSFYRGEEIRMAIAYREPVEEEHREGNTP